MEEAPAQQEAQTATLGAPIDLKGRKIAIGVPSGDTIPVDFHNSFMQMVTQTAQFVSVGLTNSISSRIAVNRNTIVDNARQLGVTDILWIDSDSIFPIHALVQLIMHNKDIVCATTCRRKGGNREPIGFVDDVKSIQPYQKLVKMRQVGLPFMLTKMAVFDKMDAMGLAPNGTYFAEPPRWMVKERTWNMEGVDGLVAEDEYFCYLAYKAGFDIWCDMELSMQIGHMGMDVHYIEQKQPSEARVDEVLA